MAHKPGTTPNSANLNNGPVRRAAEISHVSPKTAKPVPVTNSGDTVITHPSGFPVQPKPAIAGEDKNTQRVIRALQDGPDAVDNGSGLGDNTPVTMPPETTMQTDINGTPNQQTSVENASHQRVPPTILRKHGTEKGNADR